ncbi:MAG: CdaR family protein [Butyricicoccus sp.]
MKKNFIKKQDFLLKILSLALSIVLWAVVMDVDNPERNMRFDDVPVRISGASQLKAATGLELIEGEDTTVTVSLRGQSKSVGEVRASQITATVDISGLTEANEYDLPVNV